MIKVYLKVIIVTTALFTVVESNGQELEQKYFDKLNDLKSASGNQESEVKINVKMLEKFYTTYDEVDIVPWKEVFTNEGFEDVKIRLNAYNNIDMNKVGSNNLNMALNHEIEKVKDGHIDGLDVQPLLTNIQ